MTAPAIRFRGSLALAALAGLGLAAALIWLLGAAPPGPIADELSDSGAAASYGALPLSFEPNRGQTDPRVRFLARGSGHTIFLTQSGAVMSFVRPPATGHGGRLGHGESARVRMRLAGAQPSSIEGKREFPGRVNSFVGDDPSRWQTDIPTYGRVKYADVYPGIDAVWHGRQGSLEYDFLVAPGAEPGRIELAFGGTKGLRVDRRGDLIVSTRAGELRQQHPIAYQEIGDERRMVESGYALEGDNQVHIRLGDYDRSRPLVIDPQLIYSTFLGGNGDESPGESFGSGFTSLNIPAGGTVGIDADEDGNAYVAGGTASTDFPGKCPDDDEYPSLVNDPNADCPRGDSDAYISKLNADGSALVYSTYLGGNDDESATGVVVNSSGQAFPAGFTDSGDFPTTDGALDTDQTDGNGEPDAFVTKINSSGSGLLYSTYIGGGNSDIAAVRDPIALDSSERAMIVGSTTSGDFTSDNNAFQTDNQGGEDLFVTRLNSSGSALIYFTFLGGSEPDIAEGGIAVDSDNDAYVTGATVSDNFPTTSGAFERNSDVSTGLQNDFGKAFVTKVNSDGESVVYSTFIGAPNPSSNVNLNLRDIGHGIEVDANDRAFVTGLADADNFPTTPGAFQTSHGQDGSGVPDAFVTKLNNAGSNLIYSTFLGGLDADEGNGISIDATGNAHVHGITRSPGPNPAPAAGFTFPIEKPLPDEDTNEGNQDAFVTKLRPDGKSVEYSSFLGGTFFDFGMATALDPQDNLYLAGTTGGIDDPRTGDFNTTDGAFQQNYQGGFFDNYVVKIQPDTADLRIDKSDAPDPAFDGEELNYQLEVVNDGPTTATGVVVTDNLPSSFQFVSASPGCNFSNGKLTCDVGSIDSTDSKEIAVTVRPTVPGQIPNTAVVTGTVKDPNTSNNQDTEITSVVPAADMSIDKSDTPDPALTNQPIDYTLNVQNNGPDRASQVQVSDQLPPEATFVSAPGSCTIVSGEQVNCPLGDMQPNQSVEFQIRVFVSSPGNVSNTATVDQAFQPAPPCVPQGQEQPCVPGSNTTREAKVRQAGETNDPNPDNNTSTEPTTILPTGTGTPPPPPNLQPPPNQPPPNQPPPTQQLTTPAPSTGTGTQGGQKKGGKGKGGGGAANEVRGGGGGGALPFTGLAVFSLILIGALSLGLGWLARRASKPE